MVKSQVLNCSEDTEPGEQMSEELVHLADRQDRKSRGTTITGFKHNMPDLGEPGRRLAISLCWQLPSTPSDAVWLEHPLGKCQEGKDSGATRISLFSYR